MSKAASLTSPASQATSLGRRFGSLATAASTETKLAIGALLVIAAHVLDDALLQPQPGTSPADHLVSALVPTACLVLAAVFYARLRPGLRATLALLLGLFGIVTGIEAVYYLDAGRLSGDDYSGLVAIAAGLVLICVGGTTLWRSRRVGGSRLRRWSRLLVLTLGAAVGLYVIVLPFLSSYVLTHAARAFVPVDHLGAAHQDVSFTTADGLRLRGWYVPSKNGAAVISFPGRKGTQKPARMLARHGYGVLLFDRRGEGESEGDPNGWGWSGYQDVTAAVRFLQRRPDVKQDRIGGIGLSVGGEMMLEAAARSRGLKALVSEGAGERSLREFLDITGNDKWPALPSYAALTAGVTLFTGHAPPPSLVDLVSKIAPTPVFLIYGEHGQDGERNLNPTYYEKARRPKLLWEVPGSGHVGGSAARPAEYEKRVVGFFDRALLASQAK